MSRYHAAYLAPAIKLETRKLVIKEVCRVLRDIRGKFSHVACSGVSGLLIAPSIADKMRKRLIIIRKGENCHSSSQWEADVSSYGIRGYVIVDDLVSSGETVKRILGKIRSSCVGVVEYNPSEGYELGVGVKYTPIEVLKRDKNL